MDFVWSDVEVIPTVQLYCLAQMVNVPILAYLDNRHVVLTLCVEYRTIEQFVYAQMVSRANLARNVINWNVITTTIVNLTNSVANLAFVQILAFNMAYVASMLSAALLTVKHNAHVPLVILGIPRLIARKVRL